MYVLANCVTKQIRIADVHMMHSNFSKIFFEETQGVDTGHNRTFRTSINLVNRDLLALTE
jgi:hypothetical protein